jgi:N-methylhydantoinase A
MQFLGQTHIIKIPLKDAKPSKNFINKEFEKVYFKRFKVKLEKILPVIVNINVSVIGKRKELDLKKLINFTENKKNSFRKVYFNGKWHKTPIYLRENLFPKFKKTGPAIIEQLDTTIVIHPKDNFFVDEFGNIIIEIYND